MPWIEATLRGQRVLARAQPDRALVVDGGRVEIRYGTGPGRPYHASARNLEVGPTAALLPDDACAAAAPAMPAPAPRVERGATAPVSPGPSGATGWIAYTDGACSGNPGPAGCGIVLISPEGKVHEGFEFIGQTTNNVAELTAILRAVEWVPPGPHSIVVHTDSQYAIGVVQKGWRAKANQELVAKVRAAVGARHARLVYVPGHQGVPLNERADALARDSITQRRTERIP